MCESIRTILMVRDGISAKDADDMILDAQCRVVKGEDPEEILLNEFGLEPDYIFELL